MNGYFEYLCQTVGIYGNGLRSYKKLAGWLHTVPFSSDIPGDQNRVWEALQLRQGYSDAPPYGCTVFELLVSLCKQMTYISSGMLPVDTNTEAVWFNVMIQNLGLGCLTNDIWDSSPDDAHELAAERVGVWMYRHYDYDGSGGLFPLENPKQDQVTVELWYQMNAYLMEMVSKNG